jgi:hypothetical protein
MSTDSFVFNGVDAATGSYLTPALSAEQVAQLAQGEALDAQRMDELRARHEAQTAQTMGVPWGVDAQDLGQAGWGVVFAHDADPQIHAALAALLKLRTDQAGARYKEFSGTAGVRPDDTARTWLTRQGVGPGQPQVKKVPYYLLVVGDPESISFRFQYELGLNYAVGRIVFDAVDEYLRYASTVVTHDTPATRVTGRNACFFGVRNADDQATTMSAERLVEPLAAALESTRAAAGWKVKRMLANDATRTNLRALLNGGEPPSLLFTASHGMGFPKGHALQDRHQGALLCQEWPGPRAHRGAVPPEFYFSADDLSDTARLGGMVAFHFACYSAGTPKLDDYAHRDNAREQIAPHAFVADLPRRMLGLPGGGALAAVGHVERAWGYSFMWPGAGNQTDTFENCLGALMDGSRLGPALEAFSAKHADLAVNLNGELENLKFGAKADPVAIANLWTANNDARGYVIIGDPAVRIPH